ncbi:hypothetical protein [Streptomyces scabiei]|jgi:hypothetical protein|uniref:hypothetical protein n=1 Tax=Streptomyces scabiei TaxID=1930 RepID=UPI0038F713BC
MSTPDYYDPEFNNPDRAAAGEAASNARLAAQNGDTRTAASYTAQADRARDRYLNS